VIKSVKLKSLLYYAEAKRVDMLADDGSYKQTQRDYYPWSTAPIKIIGTRRTCKVQISTSLREQ
jgi:hypothetical protein